MWGFLDSPEVFGPYSKSNGNPLKGFNQDLLAESPSHPPNTNHGPTFSLKQQLTFSFDIFSKTKTQSIKIANITLKERVKKNYGGEKSEGEGIIKKCLRREGLGRPQQAGACLKQFPRL